MSEITNLFRATILARGQEAVSRLTDVYFPSINCPQETAVEFITQLTTQDPKGFRRWFSE
jgi:exportin-T